MEYLWPDIIYLELTYMFFTMLNSLILILELLNSLLNKIVLRYFITAQRSRHIIMTAKCNNLTA